MSADILAAFIIGFLGSSHCLVMCGGIVAALQLAMPQQRVSQRLALQLMLSVGRLTSYALMGAVVGYFGVTAMQLAGASLLWLRLIAGILLLMMALYISRVWFGLVKLERLGQRLWALIQPLSKRFLPLDTGAKAFGYGLCWGWLPCGLVYSTLGWSLGSGGAVNGAAIMLAFGAGTLPAILVSGTAAAKLSQWKNIMLFRYIAATGLAIYACYTIWLALRRLIF